VPNSLEIQDIPGGKQVIVGQARWAPLKGALILLALTALLALIAWSFLFSGNWTIAVIAGGLALLSAGITLLFGIPLAFLSLTLRDRAAFTVTADGIRIGGGAFVSAPEILSIHHGAPRASSGVEVGIAGDIASLTRLAFAGRDSAVWLRVGRRAIYLARQIRRDEAAQIFEKIRSIVTLT